MKTGITIPKQKAPSSSGRVLMPSNVSYPAVGSVPIVQQLILNPSLPACSGSTVQASVISYGPFTGMGSISDVVSLISTSNCIVLGYVSMGYELGNSFSSLSPQNGLPFASLPGPFMVEISPSSPASFLLQYYYRNGVTSCPPSGQLEIAFPGNSSYASVSFAQSMVTVQSAFNICGGKVNITPVEPGNSPYEY